MAYGNTFMRSEIKFILNAEQYAAIRSAIAPYMTEDQYGKHTICNIYCDNDANDLIRTSLDKPVYKEKLRLRSYGAATDDSTAFLEIKKKFKGVVYKRRVKLPYKQALDYLMSSRTTISIAHRLSTVKKADEIIVMNEGQIVERGKHDELIEKNGYYKKLYEMQSL